MILRPISEIAHDLQSPLMVVKGFLDMLTAECLDADQQLLHGAAKKSFAKIRTLLEEFEHAAEKS